MRQYFKSIITLALLSLSVISCNNDFDEDIHFTYPNEVGVSTWTDNGSASKNYIVNFTIDEKGNHICDIVENIPSVGVTNTFTGGKYTYKPEIGLIHVEYEQSPFGDDIAAVADFSILSDGKSMIGGIYEKDEEGELTAKGEFRLATCDTLSILGKWNVGSDMQMQLFTDNTATVKIGDNTEHGTFVQTGNDAVVTTESNKTYKFHVNADRQVVYTENGTETTLSRNTASVDDWTVIATGTYVNWLFGEISDLEIQYSVSRRVAKIKDFAAPGSELAFYWAKGQPTVIHTSNMYDTKYVHVQDGVKFGLTFASPVQVSAFGGNTAFYDANDELFYFGHRYVIPGKGEFGANIDNFIVYDWVEE